MEELSRALDKILFNHSSNCYNSVKNDGIGGIRMLICFGAENFSSFREGVDISFEFGTRCPEDISGGERLSRLLCIKGANSSGKTNILKILSFLRFLCVDSFHQKPDALIPIDSHFFNDEPSYLFCQFLVENVEYSYEVKLDQKTISYEKLTKKVERENIVFERIDNQLGNKTRKNILSQFGQIKIRNNVSFINLLYQYEFDELAPVYHFFETIFSNVNYAGYNDLTNEIAVSNYLYNNQDDLNFVLLALQLFEPLLKHIHFKAQEINNRTIYTPLFDFVLGDQTKTLSYELQSNGIKTLYKTLPIYIQTLKSGGVLALDEFDVNLHPLILPFLTGLFSEKENNPHNAQFIFTSHNSDIMDSLTKYRNYLVNKENGESYAYRLDEIGGDILRNDRSIAKIYNQSKIGGVPNQNWGNVSLW